MTENTENTGAKGWRLRYSHYLLTFNSNMAFHDPTDPELIKVKDQLIGAVRKVLSAATISQYIEFIGKAKQENHQFDSSIKDIQIGPGGFELGEQTHYAHLHFMVLINHWSSVKLDLNKIRDAVKQEFGGSVYFNATVHNNSQMSFEYYIKKTMMAKTLKTQRASADVQGTKP